MAPIWFDGSREYGRVTSTRRVAVALGHIIVTFSLSLGFAHEASADTLSLSEAIDIGMQNAPQMRRARGDTALARANEDFERARYYPSLRVELVLPQYSASRSEASIGIGPKDDPRIPTTVPNVLYKYGGSVSATAEWAAFDFGRGSSKIESAEANVAAAAASEKEAAEKLKLAIAAAHLTLFYQEQLLEQTRETVESRDKLAVIAHELVRTGLQPVAEEFRAGSRVEAARRELARQQLATEQARTVLASAIGRKKVDNLHARAPRLAREVDDDPAQSARRGEENRASVAAARLAVDAGAADVTASERAWRPTVTAFATGTLNAQRPDVAQLGRPDEPPRAFEVARSLLIGLRLNAAFDFTQPATTAASEARLTQAEADLDSARRGARDDARLAALSVRSGASSLTHARKAEELATNLRTVVEARYLRGLASPLELVDAEDSYVDSRSARVAAELEYAKALVQLCVLTGQPFERR